MIYTQMVIMPNSEETFAFYRLAKLFCYTSAGPARGTTNWIWLQQTTHTQKTGKLCSPRMR